ncbi:MAG: methyltransferase domain-containing protein [Bacteroidia bacterium]|nr:methyltransferase domain-containing protein [Bacteroidia bacterium]
MIWKKKRTRQKLRKTVNLLDINILKRKRNKLHLLPENKLILSPIVANNKMNRERNASGINSYEKEFKFKPEKFLTDHINKYGKVKWLDLCCGQGKALVQCAEFLEKNNFQNKAQLKGIDLIDYFIPVPTKINCLEFEVASLINWTPKEKYDLITCVHGIHYLGDKLLVLSKIFGAISKEGCFIGNFDLKSIVISVDPKNEKLKNIFKVNGINYNGRTKIISCKGTKKINFGLKYLGADENAGPNYTGQEAVNSHYE